MLLLRAAVLHIPLSTTTFRQLSAVPQASPPHACGAQIDAQRDMLLPWCMQIGDALGHWGQPWGDSSSDVYSPVSTEPYPVQGHGYPQYGNGCVLQVPAKVDVTRD